MDSFFANADLHPLAHAAVIFLATLVAGIVFPLYPLRRGVILVGIWILALGGFFGSIFLPGMDDLGLALTEFAFIFSAVCLVKFLLRR